MRRPTLRTLLGLLAATLVLAGLVAPVTPLTPSAGAAPAATGDLEAQFVARINGLRSSRGLGTLAVHGELTAASRSWAGTMAGQGRIFHASDLSSGVSASWTKLGENVGVGGDVDGLFDAFVASPTHLDNLVDPAFSHVGVGVVISGGRIYTTHRFMALAAVSSATASARPEPTTTTATATATATTVHDHDDRTGDHHHDDPGPDDHRGAHHHDHGGGISCGSARSDRRDPSAAARRGRPLRRSPPCSLGEHDQLQERRPEEHDDQEHDRDRGVAPHVGPPSLRPRALSDTVVVSPAPSGSSSRGTRVNCSPVCRSASPAADRSVTTATMP